MFFHNLDIDMKIHFDEFYYFDVDRVGIVNEIFDCINHIEKLQKKVHFQWNFSFRLILLSRRSISSNNRFIVD
jgi:hypothetical protein